MNYIPLTDAERTAMCAEVGVARCEDLFVDVPHEALLTQPLPIEPGREEMDVSALMHTLAHKNRSTEDLVCFAGGGFYDHYRPAFIDSLMQRPEFFTAYTPYQPEVSQGTLQATFEFQTGICALTGLDVANASMYDGATALVEAALMACRVNKKRQTVLVAGTLAPEKIETLQTYAASGTFMPVVIEESCHQLVFEDFSAQLDENCAAVLLPYPNYYGIIEDIAPFIAAAHEAGALVVLDCNPILLSILKSPADLGADIAVGEGQSLGNALSFGGPGLGFFACTSKAIRQMPGRLVGRTTDAQGKTGYVLTLATREQHIRREKATSNICSNHALNALIAGAYLAGVGPAGLRSIAKSCISKAHYLADALGKTGAFEPISTAPFGYEFALRWTGAGSLENCCAHLVEAGILPGIPLGDNELLIAVTEQRSKSEMDLMVREVSCYAR